MKTFDQFSRHQCRITPRLTHNGRDLKPGAIVVAEEEHEFEVLWQQDATDPYPGEWAMSPTEESTRLRFASFGLAWISSGDLTFIRDP